MTGHKIVEEDESGVIPMSEMKPCQTAVIVGGSHYLDIGKHVRRTENISKIEIETIPKKTGDKFLSSYYHKIKVRPTK